MQLDKGVCQKGKEYAFDRQGYESGNQLHGCAWSNDNQNSTSSMKISYLKNYFIKM